MNLLDEAWIPVRRSNGEQDWITPLQITDPTIVALDARRPDFNGALIQFLIGLVQTTTPMDSEIEWKQWNEQPPTTEQLQQWFELVREAFVFDGDGARFMQDFSLRTEGVKEKDFNPISGLLIDAPGENTLKENKDHFVKRDTVNALCLSCTATALFTLQVNAPSGGQGHNTSIRGGGPLTTILLAGDSHFLWQTIWLNIKRQSDFLAVNGDATKTELEYSFPWVKTMNVLQLEGGQLTPIQVHPAHNFWGTPRRIRLDLEHVFVGDCDCCGRQSGVLVDRYITKAKGFNYKGGWNHPLSPYYENKPGEMLALHPQPGGIGYKHWLAWSLGLQGNKKNVQPASIVSYVLESQRLKGKQCRLYAFGYDMDSMKARCWYESTLPLYGLSEKNKDELNAVQREIQRWLEAADLASFLLRDAVKSSWFVRKADGSLDARGDYSFIDASFWSQTENGFYQLLRSLIDQAREEDEDIVFTSLREQWRDLLIKTAIRLFDADLVGAAPIAQQNPRRTAEAYNRLCASLRGDKLKETLKLQTAKAAKKTKKSKQDAA
ncbi:type I-E CRISPR-associated protein Cse1/CasA [Marinomonas sp. A79]|uniref:Type I-E CRISPR-associated protein Cse1/CasA n=1 Tax=Marinomonas vulgaris TaxID=2823372 RepID=A0ABS5H7T9_9GAMM|nr:type I-E CRISPR-associated protein Cse1/CasA [Marinomonas vulgaris]MBR7887433.1 type I-E CRISPR-associated protein Cse1/CasA [Marinomonas vulgaris]